MKNLLRKTSAIVLVLALVLGMTPAVYAADEYTITFKSQGSTEVDEATTDDGKLEELSEITQIAEVEEYTINFQSQGGSEVDAVTTVNGKLEELPETTKTAEVGSYEFVGWYDDTVAGQKITTETVFTEDTTVYARWSYSSGSTYTSNGKTRTILTTDGEVDDCTSFVRFLTFANEYDIEGIVLTSSQFHWSGNGDDVEAYRWMGTDWVYEWIDAYSEGYPNLVQHAEGYPTPEYLRSVTKVGNISNKGEMEEHTEGAKLIKDVLMDTTDSRQVVIQAWGGPNSIAAALKWIEDEYKPNGSDTETWEEIYRRVSDKAILSLLLDQDGTAFEYIHKNWPEIETWQYHCDDMSNAAAFAYMWNSVLPDSMKEKLQGSWVGENLQIPYLDTAEGSLAGHIFTVNNGKNSPDGANTSGDESATYNWVADGDSVGFFNLIEVGLRSTEDATWGGWGGRMELIDPSTYQQEMYNSWTGETTLGDVGYVQTGWGCAGGYLSEDVSRYYMSVYDNNTEDFVDYGNITNKDPVTRYVDAMQSEFAARAEWLVTENYEDANHAPVVSVDTALDLTATAGQEIVINGSAADPDGDNVDLYWMYYWDAGTYGKDVAFEDDGNGKIIFNVPEDAQPGDTIHMVLTGTDDGNGDFGISRYQRVIVTVAEATEEPEPNEPEKPVAPSEPDKPVAPSESIDGNPETGDNSGVMIWVTMIVISLIGVTVYVLGKKRKYTA